MLDDLLSNPWAYLPPRSSLWLWVGGPLMIVGLYFLTMRSSAEKKKRLREVDIWRANLVPEVDPGALDEGATGHPYRPAGKAKKDSAKAAPPPAKKKSVGPPRVATIPGGLQAALNAVGGGDPVAHYELVADLAYLSLMESNGTAGSDHQTVSAKLESRGPQMVVRPLPIVDGVRVPNTGVQFKKDPELMGLFLVEGPDAKAIGKWLSAPLRRALCQVPSAWVRVEGTVMTVTLFGTVEADQLDALVELADTIFAEHGAEGGPSLYPDESEGGEAAAPVTSAPAPAAASSKGEGKAASKTQVSGAKGGDEPVVRKPKMPSEITKTLAETPASKKKKS